MAKVTTYMNFMGTTEAAFNFYKSVFKTEFSAPIFRMGDAPAQPGMPPIPENEKNAVMHVALPILGGHELMGTDVLASMGHKLERGNNITLNLMPDTRAETQRLYKALSEGGTAEMPLTDMFWGAYFGIAIDKFGTRWMFNCYSKT